MDSQIHGPPTPTHSATPAMEQGQFHIKLLAHLHAHSEAVSYQIAKFPASLFCNSAGIKLHELYTDSLCPCIARHLVCGVFWCKPAVEVGICSSNHTHILMLLINRCSCLAVMSFGTRDNSSPVQPRCHCHLHKIDTSRQNGT